ncbi:LPS glycosyltransferase [Gregarina niphandrodes]|uniref:LPS glycosyltransferase n=1 Tax=Gregarina niphandrodes TaxID=110365 RepID=A0A023AZ19_GRENI|nr:LPS glycosyltransferase [Gregarina niphandrodes]EZG43864.1 LPS glycosyltransferase [Gregarina niphandrodes]|eukprot:XP_011132952.1 LPS glycosyltransferase [Gregarina niphandrodes]
MVCSCSHVIALPELHTIESQDMFSDEFGPCEILWNLPFYYVNLDRSVKRREYMERTFPHATRIRAVDGRDPSEVMSAINFPPDERGRGWSPAEFAHYTKRVFGATPGELGCYASRLDALKQMYEDGHELALVGEDDVDLNMCRFWTSDLARIVRQVQQEDADWHLLRLQWSDKYAHMQTIRDLHLDAVDDYLDALVEATVNWALRETVGPQPPAGRDLPRPDARLGSFLSDARLEWAMDRAQQDVNMKGWVDTHPAEPADTDGRIHSHPRVHSDARDHSDSMDGRRGRLDLRDDRQVRRAVKERWLGRYRETAGDWVLPATGRYAHGYGTVIALWTRKGAKATIDALSSAPSTNVTATGRGHDGEGAPPRGGQGRWRCTGECIADYHFEEVNAPHAYIPLPPLLQVALLPPEQGTGIRSRPEKTYIDALAELTGLGRSSSDLKTYMRQTRFTEEWFQLIEEHVRCKLQTPRRRGTAANLRGP